MYRSFCTAVTCMDGRIQLPGIAWLREFYKADYVDTITEAGPIRILANQSDPKLVRSIMDRLDISINLHNSRGIAVFGHYDCAGNPVPEEVQLGQIRETVTFLKKHYPQTPIIGLWVDACWKVNLLEENHA